MPIIVDLNAELAKLTSFRRTPETTPAERKGSVADLAPYRDGRLLAIRFSGKDHWERHLTGDELIHILDGTATLEMVCDAGPPRCFALPRGTIAVIPQGAWHRFHAADDTTELAVTPFPCETIAHDLADPRTIGPSGTVAQLPAIIDLNAVADGLTVFRGRAPQTTFAARKGTAARLGDYRDGMLLLSKSAGKGHWETHPEDELVHVLDGVLSVDMVEQDTLQSVQLTPGMMIVVPPGAWHRVWSVDAVTVFSATIPGEHIDLDISDPRAPAR